MSATLTTTGSIIRHQCLRCGRSGTATYTRCQCRQPLVVQLDPTAPRARKPEDHQPETVALAGRRIPLHVLTDEENPRYRGPASMLRRSL
jgi:hypothetical protein